MTQGTRPNAFVEAKLLGIMLAGIFAQTRDDCSEEARLSWERPASGAFRISARSVENTLTDAGPVESPTFDPPLPEPR